MVLCWQRGERERETRPATQDDHSLLRVMSVHQTATLSRNRRGSLIVQGYRYFLLRFSVFEWSALRFHDTLVIFDSRFIAVSPTSSNETITLPRSKPSNGIRWLTLANSPLLRCFYPACCSIQGEGAKRAGMEMAKNPKVEPSIYDSVIQVPLLPGGSYVSSSARVSALQRISPRSCGE